ncbi:anti-sigma factor family protein [Nocardioides ochotonae]|uniref:anti-sigma factor family protein n=1 Tax=Nocardioides ochotonae TaxID=2685869 RepID=UPI00140ABA80|nr:zf-HC2 domain-containing protein [Nocardioides ochotonae]
MIGHLGTRVSALLDGQLTEAEADRAWAHVHQCHSCRDQVEREGWVKTRLAGLALGGAQAPDGLKGSLRGALAVTHPGPALGVPPGDAYLALATAPAHRSRRAVVAVGSGALGAAVLGVVVMSTGPASAPQPDRTPAPASVNQVTPSHGPTPLLGPVRRQP